MLYSDTQCSRMSSLFKDVYPDGTVKYRDINGMVGEDFAEHFGEYEDDSVYIRNDKTKCDYEIFASAKTFAEATTQKYANIANQKWDED